MFETVLSSAGPWVSTTQVPGDARLVIFVAGAYILWDCAHICFSLVAGHTTALGERWVIAFVFAAAFHNLDRRLLLCDLSSVRNITFAAMKLVVVLLYIYIYMSVYTYIYIYIVYI